MLMAIWNAAVWIAGSYVLVGLVVVGILLLQEKIQEGELAGDSTEWLAIWGGIGIWPFILLVMIVDVVRSIQDYYHSRTNWPPKDGTDL